jgi:tetratricopeptide (TPR) repeat protein/predicted Ser/Thr protein kinase
MSPPSALPSRIGRYEILDRLGAGGMGVVYLATDPLLRRTVAIKVLPADNEEHRERFAREARSAAGLRHSNVVTIYDVGEHEDQPFIAMEFLDGESMSEVIHRQAPLTVERRLQLMIELCAGLGHAHRSGIVHRDIKPGNLMITTEGTLKVLDFGLARLTTGNSQTGLTRVGAVMGTPHYMSPEQIEGQPVDQRSDIFAVGVVLYELLSYQKAYAGDSTPVVLHNILHKAPAPIQSVLPSIDAELAGIVAKGLEKVPDARYQTLALLGADLTRVHTRLVRGLEQTEVVRSRPVRNLDALAKRRAAQIVAHTQAAARHFDEGAFQDAITECENALVFDPQDRAALALLERAHQGLEAAQIEGWLAEAKAKLSKGDLTAAEALIDQTLKLRADSDDAHAMQVQIRDLRRERERAQERLRSAHAAIDRARSHLNEGAHDAAIRCASEALGYDPGNSIAQSLKEQAIAAIADRRNQVERDRAARAAAEAARALAAAREAESALRQQRSTATVIKPFQPPAPPVLAGMREPPVRRETASRQMFDTVEHAVERPRSNTPKLIAAAIAVLAVVAIGIWSMQSAPAPPDSAGKVDPVPAGPDYLAVVNRARIQYQKGDARGAVAALATIPESAAPPEAGRLLETIRREADGRAVAAQQAASAANRSTADTFIKAGVILERARKTPATAASTGQALTLLDEATSLYEAALKVTPAASGESMVAGGRTGTQSPANAGGQSVEKPQPLTPEASRELARHLADGERQQGDGEYDGAISSYEAALRIDRRNSRASSGLAATRKAQAAEKAALERLKKPGI